MTNAARNRAVADALRVQLILRAALKEVDALARRLAADQAPSDDDPLIETKRAAEMMRIEIEAARKRARRHGEKVGGRWYFRTSYVRSYLSSRRPESSH